MKENRNEVETLAFSKKIGLNSKHWMVLLKFAKEVETESLRLKISGTEAKMRKTVVICLTTGSTINVMTGNVP